MQIRGRQKRTGFVNRVLNVRKLTGLHFVEQQSCRLIKLELFRLLYNLGYYNRSKEKTLFVCCENCKATNLKQWPRAFAQN